MLYVLYLLCFHACLFIDALRSPAGKKLTSWLSFKMSNYEVVTFLFGILGHVWCLIVSIPHLCSLTIFDKLNLACMLMCNSVYHITLRLGAK